MSFLCRRARATCAALRARPKILHSPCRPAISLVAAALRADSHGGCTPRRRNVEPSAALARGEREGAAAGSAMERHEPKEPSSMVSKLLIIAAAAGLLIGTTALGYAQSSTQDRAPGQRMQDRGSLPGHPGASGYAPGHEMQEKGSRLGQPGASGYAPGRQGPETTGRGSMGDRDPDRDRGDAR